MKTIGYLLFSLGLGAGIGWQLAVIMHLKRNPHNLQKRNETRLKRKESNLRQILLLLNEAEEVHTQDIEELLEVSSTTARGYLKELVNSGKLRQIGTRGRSVSYRRS